jgi:hypothetical protein
MPPFAVRRASLLLVAFSSMAACGGMVVVDSTNHGDGGAPPDAGSPPMDAAPDVGTKPPPVDAGDDAASACDDPTVCSRVIDHEGDCLGAASAGDFCDSLGTPCSANPPDCGAIGAIVGAEAQLASCGNGLSFCNVDWAGNLSAATLQMLCSAHAATGQPLDCLLD